MSLLSRLDFLKNNLFILFLLMAGVHTVLVLTLGPRYGGDSDAYVEGARFLSDHAFSMEAINQLQAKNYLAFMSLLAVLQTVFHDHWETALLIIQVCSHLLACALLVRMLQKSALSKPILLGVLLFMLTSYESLQWSFYILTDAINLGLVSIVFFLIHRAVLSREKALANTLLIIILLISCLLFRPSFPPLWGTAGLAIPLSFFLQRYRPQTNNSLRPYALILCAITLIGAITGLTLIYYAQHIPHSYLGALALHSKSFFQEGIIIDDRPLTYQHPPSTYIDFLTILAMRGVYFFSPSASGFSLSHSVLSWAHLGTLYTFTLYAIFSSLRKNSRVNSAQQAIIWLGMSLILFTAAFHSLILIDYDWRYRAPLILPLISIAATGAYTFFNQKTGLSRE